MGSTNILDLNNRLTKVEKDVAPNSYTSLKNKPKINSVTLTGNKTLADIGAAAAADLTALEGKVTDITSKIVYDAANSGGSYTQNTDQEINSFTANEDGIYLVVGSQYLSYDGQFRRCELQVMKNSSITKYRVFESFHTLLVEDVVSLNAGDVVKIRVKTDIDIPSLNTDEHTSFMKVVKI